MVWPLQKPTGRGTNYWRWEHCRRSTYNPKRLTYQREWIHSWRIKICEEKSLRREGSPTEVLRRYNMDAIIRFFANKLLNENVKPDQCYEITLLPIPKSGYLRETENYHGIILSSLAKLVNKMILNRIQPEIDKYLRRNQNGFSPAWSTTAHILALRRVIEGVKRNNREAILILAEFWKLTVYLQIH